MVVMTWWRSFLGSLVLALVLAAVLSCAPADSGLALRAADSTEAVASSVAPDEDVVPRVSSSSFALDESSGLGSFPAFMPPVAVGTDVQECNLGSDPYSTCI